MKTYLHKPIKTFTWENSKMFSITSKYFSIFNNKPPASSVADITRDFLTCYSCSYYSSMVACNHFVECTIDLIHYMLNKFKTEFRNFFSHFVSEISHSCFSRFFVKVYIVIASLKRHKNTSLVTFHFLNDIDQKMKSILSFQIYTIANSI